MTVTVFNPQGKEVAGNSALILMPAVADLNGVTVAEWNAGTALQCSTKAFGTTTDVSYVESQYLCDKVASQRPGARKYQMEELTVKAGNPQSDTDALLAKLPLDGTIYLAHRPGIEHTTAPAAGQKYEALRGIVASVDLVPVGTDEGSIYELKIAIAVGARTQLLGTIK